MSKTTLAFGSFVLGCFVSFLFMPRTSIVAQPSFAQGTTTGSQSPQQPTTPKPQYMPPPATVVYSNRFGGNPFEPVVPGLAPKISVESDTPSMEQELDGLNCEGCKFGALIMTYAGGAFHCVNCMLGGSKFELKGAAANTVSFLALLGYQLVLPAPKKPPLNPDWPKVFNASSTEGTVTLISEGTRETGMPNEGSRR